jgi:hypothetical protein
MCAFYVVLAYIFVLSTTRFFINSSKTVYREKNDSTTRIITTNHSYDRRHNEATGRRLRKPSQKPTKSQPIMGEGVADVVKRVGGKGIEPRAIKQVPTPVGNAVVIIAGKPKAEYVIYAQTMKGPPMNIGTENIRLATCGVLEFAARLKV